MDAMDQPSLLRAFCVIQDEPVWVLLPHSAQCFTDCQVLRPSEYQPACKRCGRPFPLPDWIASDYCPSCQKQIAPMASCAKCQRRISLEDAVLGGFCDACQEWQFSPKNFIRYLTTTRTATVRNVFYGYDKTQKRYFMVARFKATDTRDYWAYATSNQPTFADCIILKEEPFEIGELWVADRTYREYLLTHLVDPYERAYHIVIDRNFNSLSHITDYILSGEWLPRKKGIGSSRYPVNQVLLVELARTPYWDFGRIRHYGILVYGDALRN